MAAGNLDAANDAAAAKIEVEKRTKAEDAGAAVVAEQQPDGEVVAAIGNAARLKTQVIAWRRFSYSVNGGVDRPMVLEKDGTIGVGSGNWEHTWAVEMSDHYPRVVLAGPNGEAILTQGIDGVFRGRWDNHEGCAVALRPER